MPRPRRHRYGCTYARLLRHETEPNTYFPFAEFLTLGGRGAVSGPRRSSSAARVSRTQFVERQLVDFYSRCLRRCCAAEIGLNP